MFRWNYGVLYDPNALFKCLTAGFPKQYEERYIAVNTDKNDDRFGETTAICEDEYMALSESEKSKYGKATAINEVKNFWDKTIELLGGFI